MEELLEIFDIDWKYLGIEERKLYYEKRKKEYSEKANLPTQLRRTIALILSLSWNIILQKRSDNKTENSWMYDKSVWWHISISEWYKYSWSMNEELSNINMSKELLEELNIPSSVVSKDFFVDSLWIQNDRMAFLTKIERIYWDKSVRINNDGSEFIQPYITEFYIWYYNWTIQFKDWEASGIEYISKEKILEWIKKYPERYTDDLKKIIKRYYEYILPLNDFKEKFSKDWNEFNL